MKDSTQTKPMKLCINIPYYVQVKIISARHAISHFSFVIIYIKPTLSEYYHENLITYIYLGLSQSVIQCFSQQMNPVTTLKSQLILFVETRLSGHLELCSETSIPWIKFKSNCYSFSTVLESTSFEAAHEFCKKKGNSFVVVKCFQCVPS